jgi:transcriptional regulator with GAF, ATPase, and Fis domain
MIQLTLEIVGKEPHVFSFPDVDVVGIGRTAGNSLQISDARVSGLHGQVLKRPSGYLYRDLRSTNGSMVLCGSERVVVDGEGTLEVPLSNGDVLLLGDIDDPVVLRVAIPAATRDTRPTEGTIVARRAMAGVQELSVLLQAQPVQSASLWKLVRAIAGTTETSAVFENVARFLLDSNTAAQAVILVPSGTDEEALGLRRGDAAAAPLGAGAPPYPRGLVEQAMKEQTALLSTEASPAENTEQSLARLGVSSALVVPLQIPNEKVFGALVVTGRGAGLSEQHLDQVIVLGSYVASSFYMARLVKRLRGVQRRLRDENQYLRTQIEPDETFSEIIGSSAAIRNVFNKMRIVKDTDVTVLITGETGTGKELVARGLHNKSARSARLFAAVNCAALSESLLESELFGHVKGAFTGAHENKKGLFQVADRGTLFLDELGELSPRLQAKLLRVLQEGEVLPVGSTRPIRVDVRVVAATHRDLRAEVKSGNFREDLFYRVNVFPIHLPALRERREDIPSLAQFFLDRYAHRFRKRVSAFSESAMSRLVSYAFAGNIRELENAVQRAVLLTADGEAVSVAAVSSDPGLEVEAMAGDQGIACHGSLRETMEGLEKRVLRAALEERGWNRSATARDIGISRQALMAKLAKYALVPD